jgi:outer membrane immunogenic protein
MRRYDFAAAALTAVAVVACLAGTARAADLPAPATSYYPPNPLPPAHYDWTGIYFGGNVGGGLLQDTVSPASAGLVTPNGNSTVDPAGVVGGAQIGVNLQWSALVVGAEVAWDASTITGSNIVANTGGLTSERMTSNPQWFALATGRIGYAANDLLFYVKGGGAWTYVTYTQDVLNNVNVVTSTQGLNDNRSGWTAGGGVEYGMTENLSAKIEYDFLDFGSKTYNSFVATPVTIKSDMHMLTVGLNYRLNWAAGGHWWAQ